MKESQGKLLILGANLETIPLVQVANEVGVYTIVTDYDPNAPAKRFAKKSFNIDGMDIEKIVNLARAENINGVLVGVADLLVPTYQKACQILKLPCYANTRSITVLSNKRNFKMACEKNNIHGVLEFSESNIEYPVLVKPVDSCSGQGITVCRQKESLPQSIIKAKSASRSGQFIIEKYMKCDNVALYYTFMDGKCHLSVMGDMKTLEIERGSPVNLGNIYPSKHTNLYLEKFHDKFKRFFSNLGIENGVMLIQAFVENNEFYVYDPGFRLQGEAPHILLNAINGFDHRKMLVKFALTGRMEDANFPGGNDCYLKGKMAATIWILLSEGKIERIEGVSSEDPRVVHVAQRLHEGDIVEEKMIGTEKQVFARLFVVCDSREELEDLRSHLKEKIKVFDKFGSSLIYPT